MFDQEELEELRDDRHRWQGHVRRDVRVESETSVSGKRFFSSIGASLVVTIFLLSLMISGHLVMGLGMAGIGGFHATIDELDAQGVEFYPVLDETAACPSDVEADDWEQDPDSNFPGEYDGTSPLEGESDLEAFPVLRANIDDAEIPQEANLQFTKDIAVPDAVPAIEVMRIIIQRDHDIGGDFTEDIIELGDASLYLTALRAEQIDITNAVIDESYSDHDDLDANPVFGPAGEFTITGDAGDADANLVGATAIAHHLSFERLSMPQLSLEVHVEDDEANLEDPDARLGDPAGCPEP